MITIKQVDAPDVRLWSYGEVAGEIGCAASDLRLAMEKVRQRLAATSKPGHGGFRAMNRADVERVARERGRPVTLPAALEGFGDLCFYDDAVRALGIKPADREDTMDRARAPIATVEALTDAGRDYALANLKHLAAWKPPADVTGDKVRPWLEDQRRKREKAEEVSAARAARAGPRQNTRRRVGVDNDDAA